MAHLGCVFKLNMRELAKTCLSQPLGPLILVAGTRIHLIDRTFIGYEIDENLADVE